MDSVLISFYQTRPFRRIIFRSNWNDITTSCFSYFKKFFFLNLYNARRLVTANKSTYKQTQHPLLKKLFRSVNGVVCELKCVAEDSFLPACLLSCRPSMSRPVKGTYRTSLNVKLENKLKYILSKSLSLAKRVGHQTWWEDPSS